jgi:hypothetical protein
MFWPTSIHRTTLIESNLAPIRLFALFYQTDSPLEQRKSGSIASSEITISVLSKRAESQRIKEDEDRKDYDHHPGVARSIFLLNAFFRIVGPLQVTYHLFDLLRIADVALSKAV